MSCREAYVPPNRQSSQQQGAAGNQGGSRTPGFPQQEGGAVPTDGANDEDDALFVIQSRTRRTNIVNPSQAGPSLGQPQDLPFRPRVSADRAAYATPDQKVYYVCGACGQQSGFKANDMLRCLNCGGMTMLKLRVKKYTGHALHGEADADSTSHRVLQYSTN
ncbi:hypothetical protein VTH06DRAFT_8216 [Thermothelomyces fergusii]